MNLLMYNMYIYLAIPTRPETGRPRRSVITARKRSLGQGNIFTPVCHSVHKGMCMVAPEGGCAWLLLGGGGMCGCSGGHVWFYLGGMCGFIQGGMHGFIWGACMVLFGGMHGFIWGACMVLFGGHVWFYLGGVHGFIRRACMVLFGGACMVFSVFSDTVRYGQ